MLNRTVLQSPSKKHCTQSGGNYCIYHSRVLIEHQIKLIYGQDRDRRWLFLISMLEIQPTWLKSLPSRERKIKSTKNMMKVSRKELKGQEAGTEIWLAEHIKAIRLSE